MSERREMGHSGLDAAKSAYVDSVLERLNSSLAPSRRKERAERNRVVAAMEARREWLGQRRGNRGSTAGARFLARQAQK